MRASIVTSIALVERTRTVRWLKSEARKLLEEPPLKANLCRAEAYLDAAEALERGEHDGTPTHG